MLHLTNKGIVVAIAVSIAVFLFSSPLLFADSFWEGSITTAAYGTLPEEGMYGASNAFPINSKVVVTNPKNGRQIEVIITKRLDNPAIFLSLSGGAAAELGISRGSIINGTVLLPASLQKKGPESKSDKVLSQDPEVNPSAGKDDGELALIEEYINRELGGSTSVPALEQKIEPVLPGNDETAALVEKEESVKEAAPKVETPAVEEIPAETAAAESQVRAEKIEVPVPEPVKEVETPSPEPVETVVKEPDSPQLTALPGVYPGITSFPPVLVPLPELITEEEVLSEVPHVVAFSKPEALIPEARGFRADSLPQIVETERETPEVINLIAYPKEKNFTTPAVSIPELSPEKAARIDDRPEVVALGQAAATQESALKVAIAAPELKEIPVPEAAEEKAEEKIAEKPVEEAPSAVETAENVEIVLKPAEARPPEAAKNPEEVTVEPAVSAEKAPEEVPEAITEAVERGASEVAALSKPYLVTGELDKNAYYLQLGAYREEYAAKGFADSLVDRYPVTVLVGNDKDKVSYRVMVGPLNEDEGGALLFNFKSEGYKDAFLRKGK